MNNLLSLVRLTLSYIVSWDIYFHINFIEWNINRSNFSDILSSVASLVTVIGIFWWFNLRKEQFKWQDKYQVAKKLQIAIYKYRWALQQVRNPFISLWELHEVAKDKEQEIDDELEKRYLETAWVYERRFEPVIESVNDIENCLYEVECLFGEKPINMIREVYKFRWKLFVAISSLIEHYKPNGPKWDFNNDKILYSGCQSLDKDIFYQDLQTEIRKINDYFKPYLRLDE